jgi:carboxymethylenebutenolidase
VSDNPGIDQTEIEIPTPDGPMPAFAASPTGPPRGGIVVVQEAFGVTPHIQAIARRLAEVGWYAVAPAFFHRLGSPVFAYEDFESALPAMAQLTATGLDTDLAATIECLEGTGLPRARIGIVGFCMGGSVSFYAATAHSLGAAVTFYGGGIRDGRFGLPSLLELAPELHTPWIGFYGDADSGIATEEVEQLRAATDPLSVNTAIVRYPDAQHGFNCNDRPAVFNPEAAENAWQRTLAWFDTHIPR